MKSIKSFPSALRRGGASLSTSPTSNPSAKDVAIYSARQAVINSMSKSTTGSQLDIQGLDIDSMPDYREEINQVNFLTYSGEIPNQNVLFNRENTYTYVENVYRFGNEVFNEMNYYRGHFKNVPVLVNSYLGKEGDSKEIKGGTQIMLFDYLTPSLFNPMYGVNSSSITDNVPLLDTFDNGNTVNWINDDTVKRITDCSIKTLVRESKKNTFDPGGNCVPKYKYADFMYCKHLGQVSNNHLITLRRYTFPVGDDISTFLEDSQPDIARLVTWFGTEDNKLEDIMNYEVEATWIEKNSEYEEQQSQENDPERGPLGNLINLSSPNFLQGVASGKWNHPWLDGMLGKLGAKATYAGNPVAQGQRYDKNKIYDPINTIRSTHMYEGNLKFNHEFTLKFSYKLRAYDNINPKSAFLDLLSNILAMTYRNGSFWGGSRQIIGPQPDTKTWKKVDALIGKTQEGISDFFGQLVTGNMDPSMLIGSLSNAMGLAIDYIKNDLAGDVKNVLEKAQGGAKGIMNAALGTIRNKFGRPSLYAFSSLLDGGYVGPWHVTIGNPKNPIASFGNMIVTKAKITHSGPLGIDDFPTELNVAITLKHARPRDMSEIQKMYTRGMRQIYYAYGRTTDENHAGGGNNTQSTDIIMPNNLLDLTNVENDMSRIATIRDQVM